MRRVAVGVLLAAITIVIALLARTGDGVPDRAVGPDPTNAASTRHSASRDSNTPATADVARQTDEVSRQTVEAPAQPSPTGLRVRFVLEGSGDPIPDLHTTLTAEVGNNPHPIEHHAKTDKDGIATWNDVAPTEVYVLPGGRGPIQLARGMMNERTLELGSRLQIEGRVVGVRGVPIEGAEVWTSADARRRLAAALRGTTPADGTFAFTLLDAEPVPFAIVFATLAGRASSRIAVVRPPADGGPARLELVIGDAAGTVIGTVFGPSGAPQRDADVSVHAGSTALPGDPHPAARALRIDIAAPMPPVKTDETGAFRVTDVTPGRATVQVRAVGCAPQQVFVEVGAGAVNSVVVTLVRGSSLRGTVRNSDGEPLQEIDVALFAGLLRRALQTGVDGEFEFRDLASGTYRAYASSRYSAPVDAQVEVPADGEAIWNPVLPAATIAGVLRDPTGAPVDGVSILAGDNRSGRATTDETGAFTIPNVQDGVHDLVAWLPDDTEVVVAREVQAGARDVNARLPQLADADARLTGRFVDRAGQPIPQVVVTGQRGNPGGYFRSESAADGRIAEDRLRPGVWQLLVTSPAHPRRDLTIELAAEEEHDLGDVVLDTPVPVDIRVRSSELPQDGWLLASVTGEGITARGLVRAGRAELPMLGPGRYQLDIHGSHHGRTSSEIVLEDGVPFRHEITLPEGVSRRVDIRLPDGVGAATLTLTTFDASGDQVTSWTRRWSRSWRPRAIGFHASTAHLVVTTDDGLRAEAVLGSGDTLLLDLR